MLAPSRDTLNNMLDVCREYAVADDILFNTTKTKCMFFYRTYSTLFHKDVQFLGSPYALLIYVNFEVSLFLVLY